MDEEHRELLRDAILEEVGFVRASFSGRQRNQTVPWQRVSVRPVRLKDGQHVQFTYFDGRQDVAKNLQGSEAVEVVEMLLSLPFSSFLVETTRRRIQLQVTRRGRVIVHDHPPLPVAREISLAHDRQKDLPLPVGEPDLFLERAGIATPEGWIRPGMRRKFRQINEFLKLVLETETVTRTDLTPLRIVDCGCGSAQLTFAVYHYLNHRLNRPARVTGVDLKEGLLKRLAAQTEEWGWDGLEFEVTRILDYEPPVAPAIVLALHACDTATDEALAQAVRWQSETVFSAPCCQHHLQRQMTHETIPSDMRAVSRHGILRERLGDILTDGLRAQILRILGYRTDVIEFISTQHTAKNLLIRAVKTGSPGDESAIREYRDLVSRWQVEPYLAVLLAAELAETGV